MAYRSPSRWLTILLAIAVAAVGIAIFSPLHKHERNSSTKCSLGNIDAQQSDGPLCLWEIPQPEQTAILFVVSRPTGQAATTPQDVPARAPPSLI